MTVGDGAPTLPAGAKFRDASEIPPGITVGDGAPTLPSVLWIVGD